VSDRLVRFSLDSWQEIEALPESVRWTVQRVIFDLLDEPVPTLADPFPEQEPLPGAYELRPGLEVLPALSRERTRCKRYGPDWGKRRVPQPVGSTFTWRSLSVRSSCTWVLCSLPHSEPRHRRNSGIGSGFSASSSDFS